MKSYNVWPFASVCFHLAWWCQGPSTLCMCPYFTPFHGWVIFYLVDRPHSGESVICWSRLFPLLAAMNSASLDICGQVPCDHLFSILWGLYLGMELLGHMVTLCLTFEELSDYFPQRRYHFIFIPAIYEGSNFSASSSIVVLCVFFIIAIQLTWSVISLRVQLCISITTSGVECCFMCLVVIYISFWRNDYSNMLSIFELSCLLFCCGIIGILYVFCTLIPGQIYDWQIFSPVL